MQRQDITGKRVNTGSSTLDINKLEDSAVFGSSRSLNPSKVLRSLIMVRLRHFRMRASMRALLSQKYLSTRPDNARRAASFCSSVYNKMPSNALAHSFGKTLYSTAMLRFMSRWQFLCFTTAETAFENGQRPPISSGLNQKLFCSRKI